MFASDGGADDVDDGVDGANFVEVDIFDGHGVDAGFGFAEELEGAGGASFYGGGERRGLDDGEDRGEGAVVLMGVFVRMRMGVNGAVGVGVFVRVAMLVIVGMAVTGIVLVLGIVCV